jgi:hypothetical protein
VSGDRIEPMLSAVADAYADLDRYVQALDGDDLALVHTLRHVREARQRVTLIERALEDAATRAWTSGAGRLALDGEWVAERRFGKDRKAWKHEDLQRAVVAEAVARASVDTVTGEIIEPNATTWAVRDALVATANPSWRVTALRELDIDPDEYCASEPGRATIQITPNEDSSVEAT